MEETAIVNCDISQLINNAYEVRINLPGLELDSDSKLNDGT